MMKPQVPMAPQVQPQVAAPLSIGPEITQALKQIAGSLSQQQMPGAPGQMPIDKTSPEYKQAMLQQLAATGPMGAVGSVLHQWGDANKQAKAQKQADMNAWMPTITMGE